ncbi:type II toxin-antitoxin system death-on-curing family toxin [Tetragenococcus halophilus]|uniref:type II toxin-antitoxin system death-on-curing family toxin n=1 Tax=Tetragenococcus halophilus TaxID=51669 RepID=UPI001EFF5A8E|nr:type II toxin-antitoxin system death-on-curing family toxin [Tetragenococcus halophilus]MCF1685915.1 type II toxin-antitoxin system death-on-curing family toxin [Tetragenococcus halophilus]
MLYLDEKNIIRINACVISKFAPSETIGVKDAKVLDMCIKQPYQEVFGEELYEGVYEKAGILFINLAKKHAFYNGNKRTAWVAMNVFLKLNGYLTNFPVKEGLSFTMDVVNFEGTFEELKKYVFCYLKSTAYIN